MPNNSLQGLYKIFKVSGKILFFFLLIFSISTTKAQNYPEYDELTVDVSIPKLGSMEIPIAIKDQEAYIGVKPLLDLLKLKINKSSDGKVLTGYIINPEDDFVINSQTLEIKRGEQVFQLSKKDFIITPTSFYLHSDFFDKVFSLDTQFNFRSLNIKLDTELELPVIKQQRLERMRTNLNYVKGVSEPDTIIKRNYPFFRAGMIDWGVITTQQTNGLNDNRFNLGFGTLLAGGETNVRLNYSTNVPFTSRNQFYQWRYVDNSNTLFKQVTAGKIFTRATSSLFAPVVGVQFTNTPVLNRKSFGSYTLSDFTEPRWTVELYVNNVLIDYTEADASGFYSFEVPLVYGNTSVDLRFFGPYGEERTEKRNIIIPYNFVPRNELEYTLSAGIVEDRENRKFSRFNLNYGLSNSITFGGGVEYLSDVLSGEVMPFINTSARITSNILFSGEYTYGVKAEGLLSYRNPGSFQIDLNYINYDKDQTAINFNYLEERKITFSSPIRTKFFNAFSRFSVNQIILPYTEFTTAEMLLTGVLFGVSTNLTTYGLFNERAKQPTVYSALSQTYRLPHQILFSPRLQYEYSSAEFTNLALEFERPFIKRGYINLGYENNFRSNAHTFEVGLRYAFDFSQTSITSRIGNRNSSFVQAAQGSLLYDSNNNQFLTNRRTSVGKAGLAIYPYLDLNSNGIKDEMEPGVAGVQLKNKSGYLTYNDDETVIRITDLQPYRDFMIEVEPTSLDNIAWRVENPKIAVETIPNQFQAINIPIIILGEVSGYVYFKDGNHVQGQGRIIVNILDENGTLVKSILTEDYGYFNYLGLKPGMYKAVIDPDQLKTLGYKAQPVENEFNIEVTKFGDIVDDIEFTLEEIQ